MHIDPLTQFKRRSCYINFAEHLLNAYNPNMTYPDLPYRWSPADWKSFIDMISSFGFNIFEFWLTPRLFSQAGLTEPFGEEFARQMRMVIEHAATRRMRVKMLCSLATVGNDWHSHCPNDPAEWKECLHLWDAWTKRLPGLGVVDIFPGDPGGCSRNGCTANTYIDKSLEVAEIIQRNLPGAEIEIGTWGPPFFAWGLIEGPSSWKGEFIPHYQLSAWRFDKARVDDSMTHLIKRLPSFPEQTVVAVNTGFNPESDPQGGNGAEDGRPWAREIAKIRPITTWDFSLTEGEMAIIPHYRFDRLFAQRKVERDAAPYTGGICFTMTPLLNQLSLYQSAQSFLDPNGHPKRITEKFYSMLFGPASAPLSELLPLMEIIPDWGNHTKIDISHEEFRRKMKDGVELLDSLAGHENATTPFHPYLPQHRRDLRFFFELFYELSGNHPDFSALEHRYWNRVYGIYDKLPAHVDPRPRLATEKLIRFFDPSADRSKYGNTPGKWTA